MGYLSHQKYKSDHTEMKYLNKVYLLQILGTLKNKVLKVKK